MSNTINIYTLHGQKYANTCSSHLDGHPQNHRHCYEVGPHFCGLYTSEKAFHKIFHFVEICAHPSKRVFVRSDTDMGRKGLTPNQCFNSPQRCRMGLRSEFCTGHSGFFTQPMSFWGKVIMEHERVSSKPLPQMSLYAVAIHFTGNKEPDPKPEMQPHTIILPPPNFTVGTIHCRR